MKASGFLLVVVFGIHNLYCQQDSARVLKALPVVYYTPETGFALEAFAFYSFKMSEANRRSNIRLFLTYTQLDQYLLILPAQIFTPKEKFFLSSYNEYRYFPEYFYGIGNNTESKVRTLYDFTSINSQNKILRNLGKNNFAGVNLHYQNFQISFSDADSVFLSKSELTGKEHFRHLISGLVFMHDSRDHILAPHKGSFAEVMLNYGKGIADFDKISFVQFYSDIRHFKSVNKRNVWANQVVLQKSFGQVPFRILPKLGGPLLHRGFYMGRFRDQHMALVQSEWRHSFKGKWGAVASASLGKVAQKTENLLHPDWHPALGLGLRYRVSKNDRTNIRLDLCLTPDSHGVYLYFAEAF